MPTLDLSGYREEAELHQKKMMEVLVLYRKTFAEEKKIELKAVTERYASL
jgi:hypothetical protein